MPSLVCRTIQMWMMLYLLIDQVMVGGCDLIKWGDNSGLHFLSIMEGVVIVDSEIPMVLLSSSHMYI